MIFGSYILRLHLVPTSSITPSPQIIQLRDVTTGKIWVLPLQRRAESTPLGCNRVRVSLNLGATSVALVAPVYTSLQLPLLPLSPLTQSLGYVNVKGNW